MTSTPVNSDPEKGAGLSYATDYPPHQSHVARARERLRHFVHPDGKKIHVANSPEEANHLRRQLQEIHEAHEFDVHISGTPEHLDALRKAQTHHEDRREEFRNQHGELYERFAEVHEQLDALSHELDHVTSHGVALEAHFSKFGYDAHIRTYDDDESPTTSGTATPRSGRSEKTQSSAEKGYATALKTVQSPRRASVLPQRHSMASIRLRGSTKFRTLRRPPLRRHHRHQRRRSIRIPNRLLPPQICDNLHTQLENLERHESHHLLVSKLTTSSSACPSSSSSLVSLVTRQTSRRHLRKRTRRSLASTSLRDYSWHRIYSS